MPKESLSALLDGECSDAEIDRLLSAFDTDAQLAARWSRMCIIREAREGTRVSSFDEAFAGRVMASIHSGVAVDESPQVVHLADRRRRMRSVIRSAWKPVVGFASAAAMGAAAVLVIQPNNQAEQGVMTASASGSGPVTMPVNVTPSVQGANLISVSTAGQPVQQMSPEYSRQLREYLIDHSNTAAAQGVGGTLRYARFVAHNAVDESELTVPEDSR